MASYDPLPVGRRCAPPGRDTAKNHPFPSWRRRRRSDDRLPCKGKIWV